MQPLDTPRIHGSVPRVSYDHAIAALAMQIPARSDRRWPVLGFLRASRRASATTVAGTGLRPSQRPFVAFTRSRAWRSLATKLVLSNWLTAPRIWRTIAPNHTLTPMIWSLVPTTKEEVDSMRFMVGAEYRLP